MPGSIPNKEEYDKPRVTTYAKSRKVSFANEGTGPKNYHLAPDLKKSSVGTDIDEDKVFSESAAADMRINSIKCQDGLRSMQKTQP